MGDLVELFVAAGIPQQRAVETAKNKDLSEFLRSLIQNTQEITSTNNKACGQFLYHVATKLKARDAAPIISEYVASGKLSTEIQINAACDYAAVNPLQLGNNSRPSADWIRGLEENSGVGVVVTTDQIQAVVDRIISVNREELIAKRYEYPIGNLMRDVRSELKWANGKIVKEIVDAALLNLLGAKTMSDSVTKSKGKGDSKIGNINGTAGEKNSNALDFNDSEEAVNMFDGVNFHAVGENYKADGYIVDDEIMARLKEHVQAINGQVHTRFPPEPNGILHIGHAKAINIVFGYAKYTGGNCYLRYDDTNPEKEEEKYFVGIKDMVEWLGFEPFKITHSSDYFDTLYEYAVRLIKKDLAYVCHQDVQEIRGFTPVPSPWRNRPVEESLRLFEDMKQGKIAEGQATLRCKYVMEDGKMDPVAYRIKFVPHHRTGNEWCIYPTYDFTHPLCDSIENITHSLCTKEFQSHRSMYYWLCNNVGVYCPVQWEYGRLNLLYAVVSKRKILKLVEKNIVRDWDDPRLFTLTALRRRGFPYRAINEFVGRLGVTVAQMTIHPNLLEFCVRRELNVTAPRVMSVLEPIKVVISGLPELESLTVPNFPNEPAKGSRQVPFSDVIFIEKSDFRNGGPDKNYRRLAIGQSVGLKYVGFVLTFQKITETSSDGSVKTIEVSAEPLGEENKPKAFIHWVSAKHCSQIEVRLYERLFYHENPEDPEAVPGGFLSDIRLDSERILTCSVIEQNVLKNAKVYDKFQFERLGYFSIDPDSTANGIVFNRTVSLREDALKN